MSAITFFLKKFPGLIKNAEKESNILKNLRISVGRAFQTRFYADKLSKAGVSVSSIRSIRDYTTMVPLTRREELESQDPYDLLAIQPGNECLIYAQTSGTTTNKPVPAWVTKREFENMIELALCLPLFQKLQELFPVFINSVCLVKLSLKVELVGQRDQELCEMIC